MRGKNRISRFRRTRLVCQCSLPSHFVLQAAAAASQRPAGGQREHAEVPHLHHERRVLRADTLWSHDLRELHRHVAGLGVPHVPHTHDGEGALLLARQQRQQCITSVRKATGKVLSQ